MRVPSKSNTMPSGIPQGTPGGRTAVGSRPGAKRMMVGDEIYLWILVLIEAFIIFGGRKALRRHHGG